MTDTRQGDVAQRTVAIIEARMTSTRLPGKVLRKVVGKPLLELLVERLRKAVTVDAIVVATTTNATDDVIAELADRIGVGCYRGSEDDVLDRVLEAARSASASTIVEVTGDCPLMDPQVVDRVVRTLYERGCDYASNILERSFPRGLDVQAFKTSVLERVAELTQDPVDHEHVSLYIYEHPELFSLASVVSELPARHADLRLTVDTADDLSVISAVFEELYPRNQSFGLRDIVDMADRLPDVFARNASVSQKPVR